MEYQDFIVSLKQLIGIDLNNYKQTQMERRIRSLMEFQGYHGFDDYLSALQRDRQLLQRLVKHLTINFTEFFRNPPQWELLRELVLPGLKRGNSPLKVWSAGCATGEEPYSLGMMLAAMGGITAVITATDIDEAALEQARRGLYTPSTVKNVPLNLLGRYFTEEEGRYRIKEAIRGMVRFLHHDLLREMPPASGFDLILCRNVIIYFTEEAKRGLYSKLIRALRVGGYFFAGNTEQIFRPDLLGLELISRGQFIYHKVEDRD